MLDRLIRPLFDEHVQQTTIIDGVQLGLLKSTTHLCTCDVTDLYTILPEEKSISILKTFLRCFGYQKVQNMTIHAT